MIEALKRHWPEYLMEAVELAVFMIAAAGVVALLEHPDSPLAGLLPSPTVRRVITGVAMGLTAIAIVYSPWGKRSGAHFNPAVTVTFFRLGKIAAPDAAFYAAAQLAGAVLGVGVSVLMLRDWIGHPSVNYVATLPGPLGAAVAFAAEVAISFVLMSTVLAVSNAPRFARFTGIACGILVATFISLEAPLSGMSMNPARSLGPAVVGAIWTGMWIYLTAPFLGMFLAAEAYVRTRGRSEVHCAKLHHQNRQRCIFCGDPGADDRARPEPRAPVQPRDLSPRPSHVPGERSGEHAPHVSRQALGRGPRPATRAGATIFTLCRSGVAASLLIGLLFGSVCVAAENANVQAVGPIGVTVSDLDRATAFFREVLDFEPAPVGERGSEIEIAGTDYERLEGVFGLRARVARMRLGDETIELSEYLAPEGRPLPNDSRSQDRWFQHIAIVVSDMDRAYARLREHRVRHASSGPQTLPDWNPNAGGISAFYFKDPDGHVLEVIHFPPGKGDPKWQRPSDRLFLGIDHTAIVVGDTDESLKLYRDGLGLRVAGTSENYGTEQEHLNNVFGARLRITGLRAASGPGIELLEYVAPRDGRPAPADLRANDIVHWQTGLMVADVERSAQQLPRGLFSFVSPGVVTLPGRELGFGSAALVRDPDGHAMRLTATRR